MIKMHMLLVLHKYGHTVPIVLNWLLYLKLCLGALSTYRNPDPFNGVFSPTAWAAVS